MKEKKDFIEIHFDSIKERIRYLDSKDPGKQDLDALIKRIPTIEKEKPRSLVEAIKQRIKYLEANDPHNVILEPLKQQIADNVSLEDKF